MLKWRLTEEPMLVLTPREGTEPIRHGILLYRGIPDEETCKRYRNKGISPEMPLNLKKTRVT